MLTKTYIPKENSWHPNRYLPHEAPDTYYSSNKHYISSPDFKRMLNRLMKYPIPKRKEGNHTTRDKALTILMG